MDEDIEEALLVWIQDMCSRNLWVSRKMIRVQARELGTNTDFKASVGWLDCFMKQKGLSLRHKTTCANLHQLTAFQNW